ncbi:bifunctional chorismate mutase/prephenate dehydratase [Flavonifractor sp. An100]|uniref:bifunctional chorismate mutase/prephenate dehydratase n=1 Tax=Flavonifractor sp. An100 TaxID=1965538 RepID=UPI000B55B8DD|nr:bifunctional chorismate mutase/prephenate dehydratase [Flavonifractor sp. An100]OUQ78924.1 bifunctional chorismate mutase/prephenate dehydratase [Flavonifractor sp. An100]
MDKDLEQLRAEIDGLDQQIVELFKARMEAAGEVAGYKKEHGLPVLDAGRERTLLNKIAQQAGEELGDYAQSVYRTLLSVSRSYQNSKIGGESKVYRGIRAALETTPQLFPQRPTVACQGIEGAYSQIACDRLFKAPSILYFQTFDHVFKAVESGMCQYGILPIENSTAGSVKAVYDLMLRHNFYIVRSARLKVSHNLLAKHGVKKENIREVYSHEQAINQCAGYLAAWKGVKVTVVENTAVASQMVAQSERTDVAALSSRFCGELYGLDTLEENVQDHDNNYTRFICISKKPEIYPGADRTSLMMTLPHRPGSLYNVLAKFYALNLNLQKLESRPLPGREFEFMFYFDLEASVYAPEMEKLFRDLEGESEQLRYLGTYNEVIC